MRKRRSSSILQMSTKSSQPKSHFVPFTPEIEAEMLQQMGLDSFDDLLAGIPSELLEHSGIPLPRGKSELEVTQEIGKLAASNLSRNNAVSFLGGGSYDHFVPAAVPSLTSRAEFATAYTPYQAEVSQGTLQAIYEFQTMICEVTGMEVANASLYDGGSAVAEACLLAGRTNRKTTVLLSGGLYRNYLQIVETYLKHSPLEIEEIPSESGLTDLAWLEKRMSNDVAAVVIQSPNRLGLMEKWKRVGKLCKESPTLFIAVGNPLSFGLFAPPGECGADVYAGEGQVFGSPSSFGGPYLGLLATKMDYVRKVPGRLVGATTDIDGKPGFVLTLQTREQHIRRDKATSNICTNQGLVALTATIYLALLGKEGFRKAADLCFQKSHYLSSTIADLPGFEIPFGDRFFNEFVAKCPVPSQTLVQEGVGAGLLVGTALDDNPHFLRIAVTEQRTKEELDTMVKFLKGFAK